MIEGLKLRFAIHDMYLVVEKIRNSFVENVKTAFLNQQI